MRQGSAFSAASTTTNNQGKMKHIGFRIPSALPNKGSQLSSEQQKNSELELKFIQATKEQFGRMRRERKEQKDLLIQTSFSEFLKGKDFLRLIISIYDYCTDLNKIEKKHRILEEEAKDRINAPPQLLASEIQRIADKAKECSIAYSLVILHNSNIHDRNKDQNFFDCLIYIIEKILEGFFDRIDYLMVREEVNRLFRTNTFNLQKRRHLLDDYVKKYPSAKEPGIALRKENPEHLIQRVEERFFVPPQKPENHIQICLNMSVK